MISCVVSGAQAGVDRGGLDAAIECGIKHGGWCPKGRRAEDGIIPEIYRLKETSSSGYKSRTSMNVACSNATIVFTQGAPTPGSRLTIDYAESIHRPCLHVDLSKFGDDDAAEMIVQWLNAQPVCVVLNIAGTRESKRPGIGQTVKNILVKVFNTVNKHEN